MKDAKKGFLALLFLIVFLISAMPSFRLAAEGGTEDLDKRVQAFLDSHDWGWGGMFWHLGTIAGCSAPLTLYPSKT